MNLELMNPNVQNIILGVVANAITTMLGQAGRKAHKLIVGEKEQKADLQALLKKSINDLAGTIQWPGPGRLEEVCLFLCSPEVEEYVRQIYAVQLLEAPPQSSLEAIQQQFAASFSMYVGIPEGKIKQAGELLFKALVAGCEKALDRSIECGVLTAHEVRSNMRFRVLRDEILAIQRNLEHLHTTERLNLHTLQKFEEKYRHQVANRHKHLVPPHFDSARKIPIDSIFVTPSFTTTPRKKGEELHILSTPDFLSEVYRAVILGNPGGGKSTFSMKVCHDLSGQYTKRLLAGRLVTPILVILRDYGAEKKLHKTSILDFIEATANSRYQVKPPRGAFEYMLLNGRALVIFDGLDELLDTAYRQEVSSDIESFCELYPAVPVLVTSREVGYEQAPLDEDRFAVFRLAPFNDQQIGDYVLKWFDTDTELTASERKGKASAFLNESRIVPDLRSNPLMLGLMCSIYRGDNYIPKNRPDVYEKCAMMLFERWDKSRGILVPLPFEAHIRPAMMHLAHWIYGDESLQGGVTEEKLISKAADYLSLHRFDDRTEAENAARQFIEFCRGRAWVFTDTGTTKEGQRLFQFTHRTFLEYFAAAHLVRTHPTAEALGEILLPRIEKSEWDVVAQLAFQILNRNVEGGGDLLLAAVVQRSSEVDKSSGWSLLSFAVRCLEFMVPSPKLSKLITHTFLERYFAWGQHVVNEPPVPRLFRPDNIQPVEILNSLLICAAENRSAVGASFEQFLTTEVQQEKDEIRTYLALEVANNFEIALYRRHRRFVDPPPECSEFWNQLSKRWSKEFHPRKEALAPKHLMLCWDGVFAGEIPLSKLVEWHGLEGLFQESVSHMLSFSHLSIAELSIYYAMEKRPKRKTKKELTSTLSRLVEIGRMILQAKAPFISSEAVGTFGFPSHLFHQIKNGPVRLDGGALFGAICVCAVFLELSAPNSRNEREFANEVKKIPFPLVSDVLLARLQGPFGAELENALAKAGFSPEQRAFISRWIRKEISLVSLPHRNSVAE